MAKKAAKSPKTPKGPTGPTSLTMRLNDPGMSLLHRAGLGGLAATLRAAERRHRLGRLADDQLPGGPPVEGRYAWTVEPQAVTLQFGQPQHAAEYLKKLFAFSFAIKDKLIDLPGTYRDELSRAVRAELHQGLLYTFLQHGNTRSLGDPVVRLIDPVGDSMTQIAIEWRPCADYKHQSTWQGIVAKNGTINTKPVEIEGPLYPGGATRHVAHGASTKLKEPLQRAIPLLFAPVGCLSLPARKGLGILLIPGVVDLVDFAAVRPRLTPARLDECRVGTPGDGALQLLVRLLVQRATAVHARAIDRLHAIRFAPQPWDTKQKYRDSAIQVSLHGVHWSDDPRVRQFRIAFGHLPRRVTQRVFTREHDVGVGRDAKNKQKTVTTMLIEQRWIDSVVRPFIADNLARGRRWYDGFHQLMVGAAARQVTHEAKGLQAMADEPELLDDEEMTFIHAIHRAIHMARGKIFAETMEKGANGATANQATRNRWETLMERLRLDLTGAKTQAQTQAAVSELLARAGTVRELRDETALRQVKRVLFGDDWQRVRSLALFALASYKRPADLQPLPGDTDETPSDSDDIQPTTETEE